MVIKQQHDGVGSVHIRIMDMQRDFPAIADLIENSFALRNDVDGQTFLKQMRQAARGMGYIPWISDWQDISGTMASGFVWHENNQVLGNISLIPFSYQNRRIYLIANVAVNLEHRRRGIGRALTIHAVSYLRKRGIDTIWLQVKADNHVAIDLYHSLGFSQQSCRTTWRMEPGQKEILSTGQEGRFSLRRRKKGDWGFHRRWLDLIYPNSIAWHMKVTFTDFTPSVIWDPSRWFEVMKLKHWTVIEDGKPVGFLTRQSTKTYADSLWMAVDPRADTAAVARFMLMSLYGRFSKLRPIEVNYPCDSIEDTFSSAGFSKYRSLI
ncbi:MAG: GNAT family N-acetyltransferase, partial [Chloroflexota bacterium]